jgi:tryptophan synthase alpha chain
MGKLTATFDRLRSDHRPGLVAYVTAGDPDPETSARILVALAEGGADVIEVGVPFSDPLADGPVIQRASERALKAGMNLRGALALVARVREQIDTPIVLFTYANPVVRMDAREFAATARSAGVDGVLILDYPVEEAEPLRATLVSEGLDPILLISPTTSDERVRRSSQLGGGFLYVISRLGVTGARLGFGISRPEQVAEACRYADAAVVGSAIVRVAAEAGPEGAPAAVRDYVRWLKGG